MFQELMKSKIGQNQTFFSFIMKQNLYKKIMFQRWLIPRLVGTGIILITHWPLWKWRWSNGRCYKTYLWAWYTRNFRYVGYTVEMYPKCFIFSHVEIYYFPEKIRISDWVRRSNSVDFYLAQSFKIFTRETFLKSN